MLKNKKILVIGADGLLGRQVVKSIIESGAEVVAVDINQLDICDEKAVKPFFESQNNLSGAVNCSYPKNNKFGNHFFDVSLSSFNENISLILGSSFLFNQQCALYFNRIKSSFSVVNISSIYGITTPKFDIYNQTNMTTPVEYIAAKSAIINLNKYVAAYVNDSRFRVNSVSPGGIEDNHTDIFKNNYKKYTLGKGMLSSSDITGAIIFLLSDKSEFINGQNIVVDDGFTLK